VGSGSSGLGTIGSGGACGGCDDRVGSGGGGAAASALPSPLIASGAHIAFERALRGACVVEPPTDQIARAVGALHVLSAREDLPRCGAMGILDAAGGNASYSVAVPIHLIGKSNGALGVCGTSSFSGERRRGRPRAATENAGGNVDGGACESVLRSGSGSISGFGSISDSEFDVVRIDTSMDGELLVSLEKVIYIYICIDR